MGVSNTFFDDFMAAVRQRYYGANWVAVKPFQVAALKDNVYVNLLASSQLFEPQQLISLQTLYSQRGILLVHLWEDVWKHKKAQVLSRLHAFCGLNKTLHARQAKIEVVNAAQAKLFLDAHHLQGYTNAKYRIGLTMGGELKALACFAASRPMKTKGEHYQSAELIRFATESGFTIVGGLSKLIKAFFKEVSVHDLMTYADRDWSVGRGYDKLGFELSGVTPPVNFYIDPHTMSRHYAHRLPKKILANFEAQNVLNLNDFLAQNGFLKAFNTGNLKYHFYTNV